MSDIRMQECDVCGERWLQGTIGGSTMGSLSYPSQGRISSRRGFDFCSMDCLLKAVLVRASNEGGSAEEVLYHVMDEGVEAIDEIEEELEGKRRENNPLKVEWVDED